MSTVAHLTNGDKSHTPGMDFIPTTSLPEAPCSLNVFVEIPSLGKVQVTGRGCTPSQAVSNLLGQIDLLKLQAPPPLAPPALSREERLTRLLTRWRRSALEKGQWSVIERLGTAEVLVLAGAVEPGNRDGLVTVRSQQDPQTWYDIEQQMCTCPDWEKHAKAGDNSYACKHVLAASIWTRIEVSV
jgi:hypothetical protein